MEGLSGPRVLIDLNHRVLMANRAYRERYAGDEPVVGRYCYEISHHYSRPCDEMGEPCPRGFAMTSGRPDNALHIHHTPRGEEHVRVDMNPILDARGEVRFFVERMESLPMSRAATSPQGMIGRSPRFCEMLELAARVAPTETTVLVLGETGSGKEMVARLIHQGSHRVLGPLIPVDCSGLTETLFESELFGHEKGAFTGASARKIGLIEAASGGTLFLDEVGDIPLSLQVKLLRLLESGSYRRVGSVTPLRADFRLVAATHRDLKAMVAAGTFRSDLYYRISAYPVEVPALRERREDILLLADSLLARLRPDESFKLADDASRALLAYPFPGNVRELRNIIERASLLADDGVIRARDLPANVVVVDAGQAAVCQRAAGNSDRRGRVAREDLEQALARHHGDRRALAEALGISERTLYRRLGEYGLKRRRERPA